VSANIRKSAQILRLQYYMLLLAVDCLSIWGGFVLAGWVRDAHWLSPGGISLAFMVTPLFVVLAFNNGAYSKHALTSAVTSVSKSMGAMATAVLAILCVGFFLQAGEMVSRLAFAFGVTISAMLIIGHRIALVRFIRQVHGRSLVSQILIVDGTAVPKSGDARVVLAEDAGIEANINDPHMLHRLGTILRNYDRAIISCKAERQADWALLLKGANINGEILVPGFGEIGAIGLGAHAGNDTVIVSRDPLALSNRAKKRAFDLAFTVPALIAALPLLLIVALAIRLDSAGPIFFHQSRMGRGNRIFRIYKFRSMRTEKSDAAGGVSASRDDDRITRVGRFIRKTSIDELPQLINVLLGDMSLIGPRPHALGSLVENRLFWEIDRQYWHRHALKPGITGLAQVRGFRGATHHFDDLKNRLNADLEYLNSWSLMNDIAILFRTAMVLVHRNAY